MNCQTILIFTFNYFFKYLFFLFLGNKIPLGSWDELQMILPNLTKKLPIIVVTYQFDISNSYLLICFIR